MIGRSKRQLQRIVRRFKEEGIAGLRLKSRRPHTSPRRTPAEIENRVVRVREATGFGPEQLSNIVNESLAIESRKQDISKTTAYNILARHGLVEAKKKQMMGEYTFFL